MLKKLTFVLLLLSIYLPACYAAGSRTFNGSDQYFLGSTDLGLTDYPFSFACWVYADSNNSDDCLMMLADSTVADTFWAIELRGDVADDPPIRAVKQNDGTLENVDTGTDYTINDWIHVAVVFEENNLTVYYNGANANNNTDFVDFNDQTQTFSLGRRCDSTPGAYFSGKMAHAAVWDVALSAGEVSNLGSDKYAPSLVQSGNLIAYWKLDESNATDNAVDTQGSYNLTKYNDPGVDDPPPDIVTSLGGVVPITNNYQRKRRN